MSEHLETLRAYQAWRRGGEGPMLDPVVIGKAIDAVMAEVVALRAGPWVGKCQNCGHEHEAPIDKASAGD